MPDIEASSLLKNAKLNATKSLIDSGSEAGRIQFFGGSRLAVDDTPIDGLLVEVTLTRPCGYVDATGLHLTASGNGQVFTTDRITWARVVNSDGVCVFSADAAKAGSPEASSAAFVIDIDEVQRGGFVALSTVVISEG